MNPVFLDTAGLLALWDMRDEWHAAAERVFTSLLTSRRSLVTTELILLECANAAARKPYRPDIVKLRQHLAATKRIAQVTDVDLLEAWRVYELSKPGQPGVIDLTSFAVMRRQGIAEAFTHDQHFNAAGFIRLL